ncbi:MAG TPA: hypothetical protein VF611_21310, partial [Pyrinomonadaceae bacterium]
DFDGDGRPDLAVVDSASRKVLIFLNARAGAATGGALIEKSVWGGTGVELSMTADGASVEYDCAHGVIKGKITPDVNGRFEATGTYESEAGGHANATLPSDGRGAGRTVEATGQQRAVKYSGEVRGDRMTLRVTAADSNSVLGEFSLVRGAAGRLRKCR